MKTLKLTEEQVLQALRAAGYDVPDGASISITNHHFLDDTVAIVGAMDATLDIEWPEE